MSTRTRAVLEAVTAAVERHRAEIDRGEDLRGITIDVKITSEHLKPRAVILRLEFETREGK